MPRHKPWYKSLVYSKPDKKFGNFMVGLMFSPMIITTKAMKRALKKKGK